MTLTIQDLGALGELFGSVLVALTLIYLAVQMRQNTVAANIQATGSLSSEIERALLVLAQDNVLAVGAQKALNGEDLSPLEQAKLTWWFAAYQRVCESHLLQWKQGLSEDLETPICAVLRFYTRADFFRNHLATAVGLELQTATFREWVNRKVLS